MKRSMLYILILIGLIHFALWSLLPRPLGDEILPKMDRLQGVSYSPFRPGHDPAKGLYPSAAQIEEDMALLKGRVEAIRTYGSVNLEMIPPLAGKYGLRVIAGVWLGPDPKLNDQEVEATIALANRYPNITAIIVGNESILRGDCTVAQVVRYIQKVKSRVLVPVTTAEPWHVWEKYPRLAAESDFIAAHFLPYWEGIPIEDALTQVVLSYDRLHSRFPNKRILMAEVGWPSAGEFFAGSVPNRYSQERFTRQFTDLAQHNGYSYIICEAFDQNWKLTEGQVGASWGLINAQRQFKFDWAHPSFGGISKWAQWFFALGLGLLAAYQFMRRMPQLDLRGWLFFGLLIQGVAAVTVHGACYVLRPWITGVSRASWIFLFPSLLFVLAVVLIRGFEMAELVCRRRWTRQLIPFKPQEGAPCPKVSIHVACHREPPEMVIRLLDSLARLNYPHFEVLLVDNNTHEEELWKPLEAHCQKLGPRFRFFHLDPWPGYKAGALNFALEQTAPDAEVIGVLDADYRVDRDWLSALAPFFGNPKVGSVQAPQANREWLRSPFKEMLNWEYAGFFHLGMVHRQEYNAPIMHGTMILIRKSAMEALKGWAEWTICEDAELGLRLLEGGWETVYINQPFGYGLVPDSFVAYKKQRFRWAFGALQIMRGHAADLFRNRSSRLSAAQRYHFIAGWIPWIGDGISQLFTAGLVLWTAGMFIFPHYVITPDAAFIVPVIAASLLTTLSSIWLYKRRVGCSWGESLAASVAGLALTYTIGRACLSGLVQKKVPFFRTPKCQNADSVWACLAMVRDELVIFALLWTAILSILLTRSWNNSANMVWCSAIAFQSIPYMAALGVALSVKIPALGLGRRSFAWRRAYANAHRIRVLRPALLPGFGVEGGGVAVTEPVLSFKDRTFRL